MNIKCRFCEYTRPHSGLIGSCALQSVSNTNTEQCEDFMKRRKNAEPFHDEIARKNENED
jgi:hypothetical protein